MSKMTDIHNAIIAKVEATLTGYKHIPNPYDANDNPELYLKKGFGVAIGPAFKIPRNIGCKRSIERSFVVILVKQVTASDTNSTLRANIGLDLMEDQFSLFKAFELEDNIGGTGAATQVIGDSGLDYIDGERQRFFLTEMEISTEYFEEIE